MEDFNNALQSFGANQGSAQSYIAEKREKFFKDYKDRIGTAVSAQAEALGLSEEKQEKMNALIQTTQDALPVAAVGGMKAYKYLKNRFATKASAPATKPSSVAGTGGDKSDDKDDDDDDEGDDEGDDEEGGDDEEEEDEEDEGGGEGGDEGDEADEAGEGADEGGEGADALGPSQLNLSGSSGGIINQTPDDYEPPEEDEDESKGQEGGDDEEEEDDEEEDDEALDEGTEAGEGAGEGVETLATTTAGAEEATAGVFSEIILPAAAIAGIGIGIANLFKHEHSPEETAPPENSIVGHATGVSDAITRGGYASAGLDSVTSLPAQNSAF